jgi:hypothetical protein
VLLFNVGFFQSVLLFSVFFSPLRPQKEKISDSREKTILISRQYLRAIISWLKRGKTLTLSLQEYLWL